MSRPMFMFITIAIYCSLSRFNLAPVFDETDFAHWLLPRDGVISAFVVEVGPLDLQMPLLLQQQIALIVYLLAT